MVGGGEIRSFGHNVYRWCNDDQWIRIRLTVPSYIKDMFPNYTR